MRENLPAGEDEREFLSCTVALRRIALRMAARQGSGVENPDHRGKTWLLHLTVTGQRCEGKGVGVVLALLNIIRARAPYRLGTATGGQQRELH